MRFATILKHSVDLSEFTNQNIVIKPELSK